VGLAVQLVALLAAPLAAQKLARRVWASQIGFGILSAFVMGDSYQSSSPSFVDKKTKLPELVTRLSKLTQLPGFVTSFVPNELCSWRCFLQRFARLLSCLRPWLAFRFSART
jgi:hypothetical protein